MIKQYMIPGFAAAAALNATVGYAQSVPTLAMDPVIVTSTPVEEPETPAASTVILGKEVLAKALAADGGDALRQVPGVSLGRMGGHALEPVIRGQQQTRLTVLNDGAQQHGGCPNRMDTPTSFIAPESYDSVTVIKGYQTVTRAGGPGGIISFNRSPVELDPAKRFRLLVGGGYESNSTTRDAFVDAASSVNNADIRALANWKDAHDYTDGNGNKVRSAFSSKNMTADLNWKALANLNMGAGIEYAKVDDALFAGASMDAPETESMVYRLKGTYEPDSAHLNTVEGNAYYSTVDHLMDNYSLRTPGAMYMKTESDSNTYGGRVMGTFHNLAKVGLDLNVNKRRADRFSGGSAASVNTLQSIMWPRVTIGQVGLFGEHTVPLRGSNLLTAGLRYDYLTASAKTADQKAAGGISPDTLYTQYYGTAAQDKNEHVLGGLLRLEHQATAQTTVYGSLSRSARAADATERYMAANASTAASKWVGNPNLKAEKHHQAEIGINTNGGKWQSHAAAYVNEVDDYILRDRARGQDGILLSDGATVYRNISARLAGVEVGGSYRVTNRWSVSGSAAYTYGENTDDNMPLAQIPPLSGDVTVTYTQPTWEGGSRLRWAATQTRVDDSTATGSGLDVGETSGYAVLDLFGSVNLNKQVKLHMGVNNLLDHTYANHLNRSNAFDPTEVQVYEPGRAVFIRLSGTF